MPQYPCWYFLGVFLSSFDSGVLKSPSIGVLLSISFLKSCETFLMCLGAIILGAYMFIMFMPFWWILPLSIMKCPSGSLFMVFVLKYFVRYKYCYPGFFSCLLRWNIFSSPSLSFCVGLLFWDRSFVGIIYVWVRISYPFSYPMSFDWSI